eukprot:6666992-Heterocapsa_arctica.AAC.1
MHPAAPGSTMGPGKSGARRKWIVCSETCSYMVPPNTATPGLTLASCGMFFTQGRASAGLSGFWVTDIPSFKRPLVFDLFDCRKRSEVDDVTLPKKCFKGV